MAHCNATWLMNRIDSRRAEIPKYSFEKHQREAETMTLYSPHVLILEGIFTLHDQRILDLLDVKIFAEADADVCLARRSERTSMAHQRLVTDEVLSLVEISSTRCS